jgi:competence protein ComEA
MSTLQKNLGACSGFKAGKRRGMNGLLKAFFSGLVALMCGHAALALDINQANEAELDSIKGMGPTLSAKILKARAHGPFTHWADLMQRVSGIRQKKAQQLSEQGLTVGGQAFSSKPR